LNRYLLSAYLEQDTKNLYTLRDKNGDILSYIEMDFSNSSSKKTLSHEEIVRLLQMPYISYQHRICVLNPDDSVCYQIPFEDIPYNGISYTDILQDGQRRTLSVKLINKDGKYTPSVNSQKGYYSMFYDTFYEDDTSIRSRSQYVSNNNYTRNTVWGSIKMSYDIGLKINETDYIWFKKGVYRVSNIDDSQEDGLKEITISLKDKFSIFEGNTGKLVVSTEIPSGSDCRMVIKDLLNEDFGDGYSYDMLEPIFDESLTDVKTSVLIRKEVGDTKSSIIQDIATQMNASYYYNECGRLVFVPIQDELRDEVKPVCWIYEPKNMDLIRIQNTYDMDSAVNMIKVIGDNMGDTVSYALVVNNDPRSPICVGQIGKRLGETVNDANVWSDSMAFDIGRYKLRKNSILCLKTSLQVKLNPLIENNKLIDVIHDSYSQKHQLFIVSNISWSSDSYQMALSTINTQNLSFLKAGDNGYVY